MGEEEGVMTGKETERGSWAASAVMLTPATLFPVLACRVLYH